MIHIIKAHERFHADYGWLDTKHHFSFGPYFDPNRMNFGALRVFNDDWVAPGTGFDMHPHRDMEILTVMVSGALEHQDSMGNKEVIRAGEVQRMTAGTGIMHSEKNPSDTEPVRLLQIWFLPERKGLAPSYETKRFSLEDQLNRLLPVASGGPIDGALHIHQDVQVYLSRLESGKETGFRQAEGRKGYLFVIEGELSVNGESLSEGDSAEITGTAVYRFRAASDAHFIFMDLA